MSIRDSDCSGVADEELLRGVAEFNDGNWFVCHEVLEELWVGERGAARSLYQGILQVAVALHHWQNGNFRGAQLLFTSGVKLLHQVESCCMGVDVAALIAATDRVREELLSLGEDRMHDLDRRLIPKISMISGAAPLL